MEGYYVKNHRINTDLPSVIITNIDTILPEFFEIESIDENTLCQYTGLTDKNGNKIWENDVTRDNEDDMTMVVRWDNEKLTFLLDDYGMTTGRFDVVDTYRFDDCCNPINEVLEVIGNIFDNSELLKEGA